MFNIFRLFCLFSLLIPNLLFSEDTVFINKHNFKTPVRNVFLKGTDIYVKTGDGLYKMEDNKWVLQKMAFKKLFVFYANDFYETDYLPSRYSFNARFMAHYIPQKSLNNGTLAQLDDRLFISVGGSLFEYSISKYYRHVYKEYSIRDIYKEQGLKVISTYSGIFINDTIKPPNPTYSTGCFCKIKGKYYLCSDSLFLFTWPSTFTKIESGMNIFAGESRKLVEFQDIVYSQNTKSINQFDNVFQLKPVHQGFEYSDMEVVDSVLLFSTVTGEVFQYNGQNTKQLFKVNTRIRDIYKFRNKVYFSSDEGLFTIQDMQGSSLKRVADLPFCVMSIVDIYNNCWIATENGLFIIPDKYETPIPFIERVEFNRGALLYYDDHIYAGSVEGLFIIDVNLSNVNFLAQYLNKEKIKNNSNKKYLYMLLAVLLITLIAYLLYKKSHQKSALLISKNEEPVLTLDKIEQKIRENNILTVENLAENYNTNPVQLNRMFKNFNTTPGKFMKKVKLDMAMELLQNGVSIEEVVSKVGYSAQYLKKELKII